MMYAAFYIAWFAGIPIVFLLVVFHLKTMKLLWLILSPIIVYGISILTGIASIESGILNNSGSALVAGVFAPLVYSIVIAVLIRKTRLLFFMRKKHELRENESIIDQFLSE